MSQLVEDNFFRNFEQDLANLQSSHSNKDEVLEGLILLIQRANTQGYNFKIERSIDGGQEGRIRAISYIHYNTQIFDLIVQIDIDINKKKLICRTSFMEDEAYIITESTLKRRIICRKLLKINNEIELDGLRFIQCMDNGKIILLTVGQQSQLIFNSKQLLWIKIKGNIKKICQVSSKYNMEIVQICNKQKYKKLSIKNGGQQLKKIKKQQLSYGKLVKQLQISHINFGFNTKADESSFPTIQKSHQQQVKIKQFIMNSNYDNFQYKSRKLFLLSNQEYLDIQFNHLSYQLQHNQSKLYSSYLKNPVPRDPNPGQNKFIFNHIELVKPEMVKFKQTNLQGGFNKILVTKASFYYCQSSTLQKLKSSQIIISNNIFNSTMKNNQFKHVNSTLTKFIAVKVPKNKILQKRDEKYQNQKNIIRLFKNGVSAYILKYYVSKQANFQFKDHLLVDFLPNSQPLSNYIQIFKQTLSLNSKAYIIVNIANALRFLNDYQIVHMDLNLNNFLMYRDYLTKLIDFGQAYSPNNPNNHSYTFKRGYTFPFCSPQYFQRKTNFTTKQDIFSMGIIMWRIIFNDYPFFTSNQALKTYKKKTYLNKILLAPQRGEAYGNIQTIDFIYRLLFKCLSPNELIRCQSSWLTIFFKIIYFYLL